MVQAPWLHLQAGQCRGSVFPCQNAVVLVPKSEVTKVLVQEAANQLTSISRSVETYRAEMERLASTLPEYPVVMAMYGVGKSFGPQLMAEIGDVRRFERKQSLVAFAGIDPMPNQSGDKNVRSNKSSKRGSPYLRKRCSISWGYT